VVVRWGAWGAWGLLGAALGAGACVLSSPDFDGTQTAVSDASASASTSVSGSESATSTSAATDSASGGASSTGTGSGTGDATGDATTTTAADETEGAGTIGSSTTEGTTTEDATTTTGDTTTTGGLEPGAYVLPASVATCVLLPNQYPLGGPATCSANATAQNQTALTGLMMIDTVVNNGDGGGRRAESYVRFDIPAEYGDLTIASATLYVQVADGPFDYPNGPSGELFRMSAFDMASLDQSYPTGQEKLGGSSFADTNAWIAWPIAAAQLTPGAPLFLGIVPTSTDGTIYRGKLTEPGSPYLEVVLQ
jgi:hypothetical protein